MHHFSSGYVYYWNGVDTGEQMIEIEGHTLPAHVSYSAITTYLKCGWQYYLGRLKGVEEEPSVWLTGGSSFHVATENYDRLEFKVKL